MSELYHSDVYLGADYSDGLKHWKYIKRYRGRNGKWCYVYANKETHKSINDDLIKEQRFLDLAKEMHEKSDRTYNAYDRAKKYDIGTKKGRDDALRTSTDYKTNAFNYEYESEQYGRSAYEKIKNNSISSINKEVLDVGRSFVNDTLKNMKKLKKILF